VIAMSLQADPTALHQVPELGEVLTEIERELERRRVERARLVSASLAALTATPAHQRTTVARTRLLTAVRDLLTA